MIKYSKTHNERMLNAWCKITTLLMEKNVRFTENSYDYDANEFRRLSLTAQTSIGEMSIHLYDNWLHTRFKDVNKACELFGDNVNKFSGKHNFHPTAPTGQLMKLIYEWFEALMNKLDSVYNPEPKASKHSYDIGLDTFVNVKADSEEQAHKLAREKLKELVLSGEYETELLNVLDED